MIISAMQPYFFPYAGYFSLIIHSDIFIVMDDVQYIRRGWMHRNRILNPVKGYNYIHTGIIKAPVETKIRDIRLKKDGKWEERFRNQLLIYQNRAPYYDWVHSFVEPFLSGNYEYLVELNQDIIQAVCNALDIKTQIMRQSELKEFSCEGKEPDDWGLYMTKHLGGNIYLNPPGGKQIYSKEKYKKHHIELKFIENQLPEYDQGKEKFVKGLSILDLFMFNTKEEVKKLLNAYKIIN